MVIREMGVHFLPAAEENEPKERRLRRKGVSAAKGFAFLPCSDDPLLLKDPPLFGNVYSKFQEIPRGEEQRRSHLFDG